MNAKNSPAEIAGNLDQARASFNVLFEKMSPDGVSREIVSLRNHAFLETLRVFLGKLYGELLLSGAKDSLETTCSSEPDSVDALNSLALLSGAKTFGSVLDDALFEALLRLNATTPLRPELLRAVEKPETLSGSTLRHAVRFAKALDFLLGHCPALQSYAKSSGRELSRLTPSAGALNLKYSVFLRLTLKGLALELASRFEKSDLFAGARTFRYMHGEFVPVTLRSIRKVEDFFGYNEAKRVLEDHFSSFVAGRHNLPLLISGLPGLGKTQMTIAYALSHPEVILILPGPDALQERLEELIEKLANAPSHKFVIFFDDIDTRSINWYFFCTHIGGSFSPPSNVMTVIASNYKFPPNISSRGRSFTFPFFDEIRCQEMIEDLFLARGMKHVSPELLSVIAADYVESFGQKLFDELSPRTLARYLELYLADREKRRRLLEFSRGEMITKPDPQAFYAMNLKLLRALYGEEAIDEIREKELSGEK
ncbi:MAG: hypothetical protein BWY31_01955 [Lentisphaerae bacterium ADurb.Bin242]|nr:MAG: hypothetical protein BWY31_01955 [Lentisphaerae bacterium ADurb.Bin242]